MEQPDEPFYTESCGASAGVNQFFGEWSGVFKFPPVSHTAKFERREEFRLQFQKEMGCRFYFTDEVKVQITLYLNEQRVRETDSTADVDNYAKGKGVMHDEDALVTAGGKRRLSTAGDAEVRAAYAGLDD